MLKQIKDGYIESGNHFVIFMFVKNGHVTKEGSEFISKLNMLCVILPHYVHRFVKGQIRSDRLMI